MPSSAESYQEGDDDHPPPDAAGEGDHPAEDPGGPDPGVLPEAELQEEQGQACVLKPL